MLENIQRRDIFIVGCLPVFLAFGGDGFFAKYSDLVAVVREVTH